MLRARWVLGICCVLAPVTAQPQLTRSDSLRILDEAHAAQSRFERTRYHLVPTSNGPADQPCQTQIGRMCYWQEDPSEQPLPEPRSIIRARLSLLTRLGQLNAQSPGDNWIVGERIRYMVESGQDSAAVAVARSCSPPRWYCKALIGYALHSSEQFPDAAAAFDSALAQMPASERCRWNDISMLLDDDERTSYSRLPCGQRDSAEARFWELAQPSFAVGANDRRTEHFSRVLLADLSQSAANAYGLSWGPDMRELLIRYGQPAWYSTTWSRPFFPTPTPIGHDRTPSFHFAADMQSGRARWNAYAPTARERYAPSYIDTVTDLAAQFAMMKRGDSALVVAVYTASSADSTRGRAFLGVNGTVGDTVTTRLANAHVRRARAEWKAMMVAMEEFDPVRRLTARAREWLAPPRHVQGAPDISTLLLFDADSAASIETLDDALDHALTTNDLGGMRRLGLYWEVYGGAGGPIARNSAVRDSTMRDSTVHDSTRRDSVIRDSTVHDSTVHDSNTRNSNIAADTLRTNRDPQPGSTTDSSSVLVTVQRIDGGLLRWLGETLHITRRDSPLVVRWRDTHAETGIAAHSIVLDLAQLPGGTYRVTVAGGPDDAHRTEVSREIRLR